MRVKRIIKLKSDGIIRLESKYKSDCNREHLPLSMLKLDIVIDDYWSKPVSQYRTLTKQYQKLVYDSGLYYFFITLTFGKNMSFQKNCDVINDFVNKYNKKLFNWDFYKKLNYLEGFAFFEDHLSHNSINKQHVHMLIKPNPRYNDFSTIQNKDIFYKAASKVKDELQSWIFNDKCIDISYAHVGSKNKYCFKQINDNCLYRFKTIGKDGLSDNLYNSCLK